MVLPVLRPLRLQRLITLLQLMHRAAGSALRGRIIAYVLSAAALLTYAGALAALDVEQNTTGANITTFGDALWWAVATITTVGYGDFYRSPSLAGSEDESPQYYLGFWTKNFKRVVALTFICVLTVPLQHMGILDNLTWGLWTVNVNVWVTVRLLLRAAARAGC